ncbi:hypothetical protein V501_00376 [Pseudogymnoascus sp. VKM F-4519 (FW-2642)]|nr:hypothetical protein V501_00376 [Pseudogymnoascus sp. VKM F-4519 (FW-2642)]
MSPLYEIKDMTGKGSGVVAQQDIQTGARILCEPPLFTTADLSIISQMELFIANKLKGLSKAQQLQHLSDQQFDRSTIASVAVHLDMAKKNQPTPIAAPTLSKNRQSSTSTASQLQSTSEPKVKKRKTKKGNSKNAKVSPSSIQKGKGIEIPETPKQTNSNSLASTLNNGATLGSSTLRTTYTILLGSSTSASTNDPTLVSNQTPKTETNSAPYITAKISGFLHNEFRLAAATPIPISPAVKRQFYESQLLLYALEKVRGEHKKRQNYHGELD